MKTQRVYLDTSVIGGCFDDEFKVWSTALIDDISNRLFRGVTSEVVEAEIADAPKNVREKFIEILNMNPEVLRVNAEVIGLVDMYLEHKILAERFRNDMLHIALAAIADVDILVSWNFRHIVRYDKIRQFNAVNLEQGYHTLDIYIFTTRGGKSWKRLTLLKWSAKFGTNNTRILQASLRKKL